MPKFTTEITIELVTICTHGTSESKGVLIRVQRWFDAADKAATYLQLNKPAARSSTGTRSKASGKESEGISARVLGVGRVGSAA